MSILSIENVSKTFGSGHTSVTAVDNVSLMVNSGEVILIMGPSGSGKTTLLSMIGTLLTPTQGIISVNNKSIIGMDREQLADVRLNQFGFVFQSANLLAALSAQQNVEIPLIAAGLNKKKARVKSEQLLERFHLGKRMHNLPSQLSGGEKQRVAIARSLANDPRIILADEPTASLDSVTGQEVMQLLCTIACTEERSVIVVSHDSRLIQIANRVITIEDGKLVKEERGGHVGIN